MYRYGWIVAITVFGLTGGVASGKSAVGARFTERGLDVIDADRVARDVVAVGSDGLAAIVRAFGPEVLIAEGKTGAGQLDRATMRTIIFSDAANRERLNGILHPMIAAETVARTHALEEAGVTLACYESPLLVEMGLADAFRPLVVVSVARETQHTRLMSRDGMTAEAAHRMIDAQAPLEQKVRLADYLIDNNGTLEQLLRRADEVLEELKHDLAGRP
jgi:dephospho-CoA kinase